MISVDTLRADHLPVYGYREVQTPVINAIARDSSLADLGPDGQLLRGNNVLRNEG